MSQTTEVEGKELSTLSIDTALLRGHLSNGIELHKDSTNEKVIIRGLIELEKDAVYWTKNKNKLIRKDENTASLFSSEGAVVKLPIPKNYMNKDNETQETAEMALERASSEKLSHGILLIIAGKDHGKVIFGLDEIPIGVQFATSSGASITRSAQNDFVIKNTPKPSASLTMRHSLPGPATMREQRFKSSLVSNLQSISPKAYQSSSSSASTPASPQHNNTPYLTTQLTPNSVGSPSSPSKFDSEKVFDNLLEEKVSQRKHEKDIRAQFVMKKYRDHYQKFVETAVHSSPSHPLLRKCFPLLNSVDFDSNTLYDRRRRPDFDRVIRERVHFIMKPLLDKYRDFGSENPPTPTHSHTLMASASAPSVSTTPVHQSYLHPSTSNPDHQLLLQIPLSPTPQSPSRRHTVADVWPAEKLKFDD